MLVLLLFVSNKAAAIERFVETFDDGLDNSWATTGDFVVENGYFVFQNDPVEVFSEWDTLQTIISGSGSFAMSLRFEQIEFANIDVSEIGAARFRAGLELSPEDRDNDWVGFNLLTGTGMDEGTWAFFPRFTAAPPDRDVRYVPQPDGALEIGVRFDAEQGKITYSYNDILRETEIVLGPFGFRPTIGESARLTVAAGAELTGDQFGLLDQLTISPISCVDGDFDGNGLLTSADLDLLLSAHDDLQFDLTNDQQVEFNDVTFWIHDLKNTYFGDVNLDGEFNSADLVFVFGAGEYEDDVVGNSTWGSGDWNADGEFTTSDLVLAFQDGGYEQGPRAAVVPEPMSVLGGNALSMLPFLRRRRGRK